jgi:hypothetical protein
MFCKLFSPFCLKSRRICVVMFARYVSISWPLVKFQSLQKGEVSDCF